MKIAVMSLSNVLMGDDAFGPTVVATFSALYEADESVEVIDLGTDVAPEKFVAAVQEHDPDLVGMSALLSTTMPSMADTVRALSEAGLREAVQIMIGGAPVTQNYADKIGADGYAEDAASAADLAKSIIQ